MLRNRKDFDVAGASIERCCATADRTDRGSHGAVGFRNIQPGADSNPAMKSMRSITGRLALVFLFLLLVIVLFGVFGIGSLSSFNDATAQVRDRWLPSVGALSDLNNVTSDYRAAEGASLLASGATALAAANAQLAQQERAVAAAERRYEQLPQAATERALYAAFNADWNAYRRIVDRVQRLAQGGERALAVELYNDASKKAYDAASDALDLLTARSIASAREASVLENLAYERARWLILATLVLICLSVAAAMIYVRRSISSPILELAGRMHRLAANETSIEIEGTDRQDEIGEMARAVVVFRSNAIELASSQIGLEQQATMLREKLAEEQRLMLLQRNFVSMASHEFRTPITIIDGHAQRLMWTRDQLSGSALVERARKIRNAVRRMTHLIQNTIDSMRIIDADFKLYFHPSMLDIASLLQEVCQLHREIAPQAQILATLRPETVPIRGDANLLFQVFSNLLSNAIKYSPAGMLINVVLARSEAAAVICVQDHGIGIPEADRGRLFERYYRGSNTAGIVGTGVGLYFVKTVIELHGGEISAESSEGTGSRFTVRLPLCNSSRPDEASSLQADERTV
jgi:two-component system, OmpR family, sensor kinase